MKTSLSLLAATLSLTGMASAHAAPVAHGPGNPSAGLSEIPDAELAHMRGRYEPPSGNTVAYFGVKMISTWHSYDGQVLEATMKMAIDARNAATAPTVTFQPTVNITQLVPVKQPATPATTPAAGATPTVRSVDGSGLANVSGLTQGVQVAGDGNHAVNVTDLSVSNDPSSVPATESVTSAPLQTVTVGNATVTASAGPQGVQLLLDIANQGSVQQWIRSGSVGQLVQLSSDYQQVSNRMELTLVQQSLAQNVQLAQAFAQSLAQMRGNSGMY